jgi:membrane-bound lytic murein transglycosylase D
MNFWIDIFAKYGRHNAVLHHRDYPQVIFKVLDFTAEANILSESAYTNLRRRIVDEHVQEIRAALTNLAAGKEASTALEIHIEREMRFLGRGTDKYRHILDNSLIRSQTGIKEKSRLAVQRSGRYLPIMERIFVEEFGLPAELTRLPFIESSFDYTAYSKVGAAGLWQFMPRTGRQYLTINNLIDERRDPIEATRAAAKYLKYAYEMLGSWPLAVTGYNHGPYGVKRRVQEMGTGDITTLVEHPTKRVFGFASNNFYPELLAALEIFDHYQTYFPGVVKEPTLQIAEYRLTQPLSVRQVMNQLGVDLETLKSMNYAISDSVWRGVQSIPRGYVLKVPNTYSLRLAALSSPQSRPATIDTATSSVYGGVVYTVRSGDTLSNIARRYRTSVNEIKRLNNLNSDLVRVGQRLVVSAKQGGPTPLSYTVVSGDTLGTIASKFGTSVAEIVALNSLSSNNIRVGQVLSIKPSSAANRVASSSSAVYRVRPGDSLWSISRAHGVSIQAIQEANNLRGSNIRPGQQLKIPR